MEIKVFGMENCAGCVTVKEVLKAKGVSFVERDVMNPDHMSEASKLGIRGVPTTVVYDNNGVVRLKAVGSTSEGITKLLEMIGV
jgi:glutaredoxin